MASWLDALPGRARVGANPASMIGGAYQPSPPNLGISGFANAASSDWRETLNKLMSAQQGAMGGSLSGNINYNYQPAAGVSADQIASTMRASPTSPSAISALSTNPIVSAANAPTPVNAGAGTQPNTNNPSDNAKFDIAPGRYYSDYPQATIGKLAGDPASAAREWANFTNTGGNPFARYMSGVFSDPMAILRAQGVDPAKLDQLGPDRLDQFQMLWDRMSGNRQGQGGANMYVDPKYMLGNIMNAQYDESGKATSLGGMLANPNLLPEEQVQNTIGLVLSSLQGFISDEALNAYSATLNEFAQDWLAERNKNPDQWDKVPFVTALRSKFGTGGGLL